MSPAECTGWRWTAPTQGCEIAGCQHAITISKNETNIAAKHSHGQGIEKCDIRDKIAIMVCCLYRVPVPWSLLL